MTFTIPEFLAHLPVKRVHEMASAILRSRTKNFGTITLNGSLMIQAGQWSRITEITVNTI